MENNKKLELNILNSANNCIKKVNEMKNNEEQKYSIYIIIPIKYLIIEI
jgi:hypothetical protein